MPNKRIYIVDDDAQIRSALSFLFMTHQIGVRQFSSGKEFLDLVPKLDPACILLDVRMPEVDGIAVMRGLQPYLDRFSVVVMTGHGDVPTAVEAMKLGAVDFVEKPFSENALVETAKEALVHLEERRAQADTRREAEELIGRLTPREKEVLLHLMAGHSNKATAQRLNVSPRTVEMHRSNLIERMGVKSLSEAVRIACNAGLSPHLEPA